MPLIDVECPDGHVREVYRHNSEWPNCPPCPACEKPTQQVILPSYMKGHNVDPVVVYQAPDGSMRFPPDTTTLSTAEYDKKGYTRIELRGWTDVRRFEKHMNASERSQIQRRIERQQEAFEASESARRSEVRRGIEQGIIIPVTDDKGRVVGQQTVRLTEYGKAIMRAAMDNNDRKGGPKGYDPGFRVESYSEDRSNRDADPRRSGQ